MPITGPELIRKVKKWTADALLYLLAAALLLWCADWAVWRMRVRHGVGYGSVQVTQLLLTPLKNHRIKADEQGIVDQPCARAIFPHGGQDPCWWLRRHAVQSQSASLMYEWSGNWEEEQAVSRGPLTGPLIVTMNCTDMLARKCNLFHTMNA